MRRGRARQKIISNAVRVRAEECGVGAVPLKLLVVGAGSVGQLYGYCAQRGGAQVDVYVRAKYAESAARGFVLYERRKGFDSGSSARFVPGAVLTRPEELASRSYDVVLLCIPSDGLRSGDWFESFVGALGGAGLVSLSPALNDRAFVGRMVPGEEVCWGMITSVSYPAPLPGESVSEPGTAYWFPPLTPALFEGSGERLSALLVALRAGGMPCKVSEDVALQASSGSAVLMPLIAFMEIKGWSFAAMRADGEGLRVLSQAIEEARQCVELELGRRPSRALSLLSPGVLSLMTRVAPLATPFDFEVYLRAHFTKVGAQTRLFLRDYIGQRVARGLESAGLSGFLERLEALDAA